MDKKQIKKNYTSIDDQLLKLLTPEETIKLQIKKLNNQIEIALINKDKEQFLSASYELNKIVRILNL